MTDRERVLEAEVVRLRMVIRKHIVELQANLFLDQLNRLERAFCASFDRAYRSL